MAICPNCKSTNTVRPNAAFDQGSSSHIGVGVSSNGAMLGAGLSKTKEAKKARDLMTKEFNENLNADNSNAQAVSAVAGISTMLGSYYILFFVIGYNWGGDGDSIILSLLILALYIIIPIAFYVMVMEYVRNMLETRGLFWSRSYKSGSVHYWMCRQCGSEFKIMD